MPDTVAMLAEQLPKIGVDAYLQPTQDEFLSEYPPECAKRLQWLCGFDGSAGLLLVLAQPYKGRQAVLFTDGRYTLQASQQLDPARYLVIDSQQLAPEAWIKQYCPQLCVGFDPWLHPHRQIALWEQSVALTPLPENPVDVLWKSQPPAPAGPIKNHPLEYAGQAAAEKVDAVRERFVTSADAILLTRPDDINWLLNIRGEDIDFNPLVLCYALLEASGRLQLITQPNRQSEAMEYPVERVDLEAFRRDPAAILKPYRKIQLDPDNCNEAIWQEATKAGVEVLSAADPTLLLKAVKNPVEIEGMRAAHRRDGRALSDFLAWLDQQTDITELEAEAQLERYRQQHGAGIYCGPSFNTIAGSGPHGAIVHYRATAMSNRIWRQGELFLCDSGGQYYDGTTDVTRTVIRGKASDEMKQRFTQVLKGHIALAGAIFPKGTTGTQLDVLARQYLWRDGVDYAHGTGHGVGSFLCVHEGPQRIGKRGGDVPLVAGMVLSNEPGYYKNGEYGIRIENLLLVIPAEREGYLMFETLTLAPIDDRLVEASLLSPEEKQWLNDYHARVAANNAAAS